MKMRFVSLLLILAMTAAVLVGCSTTTEASEPNPFEGRFAAIRANHDLCVYADKVTGVCYLWRGIGYKGGMTVMLDADGTPLTYTEAWYQAYGEEQK